MAYRSTNSLMVGVGLGKYRALDVLKNAAADVKKLGDRLGADGFTVVTSLDQKRENLLRDLYAALPENGLRRSETSLLLFWAGHADQDTLSGSLRLLTMESDRTKPDITPITIERLAELAAKTGAAQIMVIIDTCWSGAGLFDAAQALDRVQSQKTVDPKQRWIGVVASCQEYEKAVDGALAERLLHLLEHGPADEHLRLRWSTYQSGLRGDDLLEALVSEWDEERQTPLNHDIGRALPVLPNPLFRPGASEQIVEHLLMAARGGGPDEVGIWFVGRERPLRQVVSWIRKRQPGMCVVTGTAGCGKSAIAGRIVSLSNQAERAAIVKTQGRPPPGLDPGLNSITAHIQVRGMTLDLAAEALARSLGVISPGTAVNHHDILSWASHHDGPPPVIVVDGLDEAAEEGFVIATELLEPLARDALILVATRELPSGSTQPSLVTRLDPGLKIDLDDLDIDTDRDIHDYVLARLTDKRGTRIAEQMDPNPIAVEIGKLAASEAQREGSFLLARIVTAQLISRPVDTSEPDWQERLAGTVEDAFDNDLAYGSPLVRDGVEHPQAARELLAALAYSYGSGFPADDVWPAVAAALSPSGTAYDRRDVFWVLGELGRYVTASNQADQAVYRLHERLANTLRAKGGADESGDLSATQAIAKAIISTYEEFIEQGNAAASHPYLWLYAWRHAVGGGVEGVEGLKRIAAKDRDLTPDVGMALDALSVRNSTEGKRDLAITNAVGAVEIYESLAASSEAFLDDLGSALNNLSSRYSDAGRHQDAVAPAERAVEIYEGLAERNPAYLNDLGGSLNNLGVRYNEVGRRSEAVAPTERAVEIYEGLAEENPAYLNNLATTLNSLGNRYGGMGRHSDALAPVERAMKTRERLVEENPVYLNDLATSLNNLSIRYGALGRREEALAPVERAVEIRERLVEENPVFLGELAGSLNNLGVCIDQVGRPREAVAPTERAVEIYEGLAEENPAFLGDLAGSLNNLGIRYGALGRREEAVAPVERAVEIYEGLAAQNPAYLNDLGGSLGNLGIRYGALGRREEAVAPVERAVEIYEGLAEENPAYLNNLATTLNSLGNRYGGIGRRDDALAPVERAVEIYEGLAEENPAYLNNLAMALNNLSNHYGELGRRENALPLIKRAVEIRERLVADNPAFLGDLAGSLNNLGNCYGALGRREEAVAPVERAVEIYEGLAAQNPAYLNNLAGALGNLGICHSALEKHDKGVASIERAVEIYEGLAAQNPAFLGDLATSLNNLSNRYGGIGRHSDAVTPAEWAVEIYEGLAERNPAYLDDLAMALNNLRIHRRNAGMPDDDRAWRACLARFGSDPVSAVVLRLRRQRAADEFDAELTDLIDALDLDPGQNGRLTWELRLSCRNLRKHQQERFDPEWAERVGPLPDWLQLDEDVLNACSEWMETPTWDASYEYLVANAELLVSAPGQVAISQYELVSPGDEMVSEHGRLLEACRREGIETAYHSPLTEATTVRWLEITNLTESRRYLLEHRDRLFTAEGSAYAKRADDYLHAAILLAAGGGKEEEVNFVYDLLATAQARPAALAAVLREERLDRLYGLATLCIFVAEDDEQAAIATVYAALGLTARGETEVALATLAKLRPLPVGPTSLIGVITEAIGLHPQYAADFASLIQAVSEQPDDPSEG